MGGTRKGNRGSVEGEARTSGLGLGRAKRGSESLRDVRYRPSVHGPLVPCFPLGISSLRRTRLARRSMQTTYQHFPMPGCKARPFLETGRDHSWLVRETQFLPSPEEKLVHE